MAWASVRKAWSGDDGSSSSNSATSVWTPVKPTPRHPDGDDRPALPVAFASAAASPVSRFVQPAPVAPQPQVKTTTITDARMCRLRAFIVTLTGFASSCVTDAHLLDVAWDGVTPIADMDTWAHAHLGYCVSRALFQVQNCAGLNALRLDTILASRSLRAKFVQLVCLAPRITHAAHREWAGVTLWFAQQGRAVLDAPPSPSFEHRRAQSDAPPRRLTLLELVRQACGDAALLQAHNDAALAQAHLDMTLTPAWLDSHLEVMHAEVGASVPLVKRHAVAQVAYLMALYYAHETAFGARRVFHRAERERVGRWLRRFVVYGCACVA